MSRANWVLRPILWFALASTINVIFHEGSHAITAFALGFPATLHQYWVDWPSNAASPAQEAAVRAAGPAFSLLLGIGFWLAYRTSADSSRGLPLLYLAAGGVAIFFGNLMSASFVGDFSGVAIWLGLSMPVRIAVSAFGALATGAIMFWLGRQLSQWIPADISRTAGLAGIVVLPIVIGTMLVIVINQPVPAVLNFPAARAGEQVFGVFTLAGALSGPRAAHHPPLRFHWMDAVLALVAFAAVRVMALGIHLTP